MSDAQYEVTTSKGHTYVVTASSEEEAQRVAQVIERAAVEDNNPDLNGVDFTQRRSEAEERRLERLQTAAEEANAMYRRGDSSQAITTYLREQGAYVPGTQRRIEQFRAFYRNNPQSPENAPFTFSADEGAAPPSNERGVPQQVVVSDRPPAVEGASYITPTEGAPSQIDREGILPTIDAAVRGAARGVTSNLADELVAGLNALVPLDALTGAPVKSVWDGSSFSDAYDHNVNLERQIDVADDAQHPLASGLGQVTGGIAQAALGARALNFASPSVVTAIENAYRARPLTTAAAVGTVTGAAQGAAAGYGAGDTPESRERSAALGGFTGGVAGGLLSPAVASAAPRVGRFINTLRGRNPDQEALTQMITALERDGFDVTTPSGIQALREEFEAATGQPLSLADIGNATRARTGVGLRRPGGAQSQGIDIVTSREAGQRQRLNEAIQRYVSPRTDVQALDDAIVAQREAEALPLREEALFEGGPGYGNPALPNASIIQATEATRRSPSRLVPVPEEELVSANIIPSASAGRQARIPEDPVLQQLARLPLAQRAKEASLRLSENERALRATLGQSIEDLPDMAAAGSSLDMRTLDTMKRYLDRQVSMLARGMDTDTFKAAEFAQVRDLRNALRTRMREAVPEYGDYLDSYRGSSDMLDALHEGRDFMRLDSERIAAGQAGRSTAEQELYRAGAARALTDIVSGTRDGVSASRRLLNSDESRAQARALGMSEDDYTQLLNYVGRERQMSSLTDELRGSQTQMRQAAAADADAGAHAALPFNPGSPIGWLGTGLRSVINPLSSARNEAVNNELLPRMLATDPAAVDRVIQELETRGSYWAAERLRRFRRATGAASVVGNAVGGEVALPEYYRP